MARPRKPPTPTKFSDAPDAQDLAGALIFDEDEFAHLRGKLLFVFYISKVMKKEGRTLHGTVEAVRGKNAFLYWKGKKKDSNDPFFRLVLSERTFATLETDQKKFVLRHLLRSCILKFSDNSDEPAYSIRKPDFSFFLADLSDPCWQDVCRIWEAVGNAQAQTKLSLDAEAAA
jgi:hypothetical protein